MNEPDLWSVIVAEIEHRRQKGLLTYGNPVTADETIDWLKHAEEEFLDGAVYCRAAREVILKLQRRVNDLEEQVEVLGHQLRSCLSRS